MARQKRFENHPTDLASRLAAKYDALDEAMPESGYWSDYLRKQSRAGQIARALRAGEPVRFRAWQLRVFVPDLEPGGFYLVTGNVVSLLTREQYLDGRVSQ